MSLTATLVRWCAGKAEIRRDGASVTDARYWGHRAVATKLHWLADRLEADDE